MIARTVCLLLVVGSSSCWNSLIYHPTVLDPVEFQRLAQKKGWRALRLTPHDVEIVGLARSPSAGQPWICFFGGNAMGLATNQTILHRLDAGQGFGLATWAYRGYDLSGGDPGEEPIVNDATAAVSQLMQQQSIATPRVFLVGQSLGSGVAVQVAARLAARGSRVGGLVLLSPYTSMAAAIDDHVPLVPVTWSVRDTYESLDHAPRVPVPTLIIHGEADGLIDIDHGRTLAAAFPQATFVPVPNRGHNDLWSPPSEAAKLIRVFVSTATAVPN